MSAEKSTKLNFTDILILLAFIVLPFALQKELGDAGLAARQLWIASVAAVLGLFLAFGNKKEKSLALDLPTLLLIIWYLWQWISLPAATYAGDAYSFLFRNGSLLLCFIGLRYALQHKILSTTYLYKSGAILASIVSIHAGFEIIERWQEGDLLINAYAVKGLFQHKNLLSGMLLLCFCFSLMGHQALKGNWKKASLAISALLLLEIFVLRTRGAWLALIGSTLLIFGLRFLFDSNKSNLRLAFRKYSWMALIPLGLLAFTMVSEGKKQFLDKANIESRFSFWQNSLEMIQEHPLTGVGAGQWRIQFPKYGLEHTDAKVMNGQISIQRPHNDFLWMASEFGIPALLFFLGFLFFVFKALIKKEEANDEWGKLKWVVGFGILAHLIFSLGDFPYERSGHMFLFFVLLALLLSTSSNKSLVSVPALAIWLPLSLLSLGSAYAAKAHMKGEILGAKVLEYNKKQDGRIVGAAEKAESFFYRMDNFTNPMPYFSGIGKLYVQKNAVAAKLDFERALSLAPYHILSLNQMGNSFKSEGNLDEALKWYEQAYAISPEFELLRLNLAELYLKQGKIQESFEMLHGCSLTSQNPKLFQLAIQVLPLWMELKKQENVRPPLYVYLEGVGKDGNKLGNAYAAYRNEAFRNNAAKLPGLR